MSNVTSNTLEPIVCTPKSLPAADQVAAAERAIKLNPANGLHPMLMARAFNAAPPTRDRLAVYTGKRWPSTGVRLSVSFMDNPPSDLRARILMHMNAWNRTANVTFVETKRDGQVRIARGPTGYWSYLGTDIMHIPAGQQTMNLQNFTMQTPDSEFVRVVRHETGHTLGFPHEHMRRELVELIDVKKAIVFYGKTQGWNEQEVHAQVLTALEESSLLGTGQTDANSIMCYEIPGSITKTGRPIIGGGDISPLDYQFVASIYPRTRTERADAARTYEVLPGDYLALIAQIMYGDESKWSVIYEANRELIGENPAHIEVGMVLVIPALSDAQSAAVA